MIRNKYLESIVSRETYKNLLKYREFLLDYNRKINLISKSSEEIVMNRHFEDSAQLMKFIDKNDKNILDIGSGAGFPGIVMELIKKDLNLDFKIELSEKSIKKCTYLQELCDYLKIDVVIHNDDVRKIKRKSFTTLVSRAFKPIGTFLEIIEQGKINFNKILLLKGESYKKEMNQAKKHWEINCDTYDSITNPASKVFVINSVKRI
jgi:16S rRNA (guanine527-N7)-methyltransferase